MYINLIKHYIKKIFSFFGIGIVNISTLESLFVLKRGVNDIEILKALPKKNITQILDILHLSKSQLRQDIFVLAYLNFKHDGYFVEFGATDGIINSNTYLLEKKFGWTGILSEPAYKWHKSIKLNRDARIETKAVWSTTGSLLTFRETQITELSTINEFAECDSHKNYRHFSRIYKVDTISLNDLLKKYNAPKIIDYLSIDTEGSEFEIIRNFDFSKYKFNFISCEHNFNEKIRKNIYNLLTSNGYTRIHVNLSFFDDWYVISNNSHLHDNHT
jgi:FkbM family methyltransferase